MKRTDACSIGNVLIAAALLLGTSSRSTLPGQDIPLHSATDSGASVSDPTGAAQAEITGVASTADQPIFAGSLSQPSHGVETVEAGIVETTINEVSPAAGEAESQVSFGDWLGYNPTRSNMTWLAGDEFGMFSMESFPTLELGEDAALMVGTGFHFLRGPVEPDMPPRLFDIHAAFHLRKMHSSRQMLDVKIGVGAFSDFEGSARKGIRFPGHAVSYRELNHRCVSVLGVEVLDRDDITLLPVVGFVWRAQEDLICDVIFPRPKIQWQISDDHALYVAGELGGGTWAIERVDRSNDNATYRDLRITCGVMDFAADTHSVLELGWAFDRELHYRSARGDRTFEESLILRCHVHY